MLTVIVGAVINLIGIGGAYLALFTKELDAKPQLKRAVAITSFIILLLTLAVQVISTLPEDPQAACNRYGLQITQPAGGYATANGTVVISGTYTTLPPPQTVKLVVTSGNKFWPRPDYVTFDIQHKTWAGTTYGDDDYFASIDVMGKNGRLLAQYFETVGQENGQKYTGITAFPEDVVECDRVPVTVTK